MPCSQFDSTGKSAWANFLAGFAYANEVTEEVVAALEL